MSTYFVTSTIVCAVSFTVDLVASTTSSTVPGVKYKYVATTPIAIPNKNLISTP